MNYEYEDFSMSDMEDVLEYWQDISQDPKFISNETGLSIDKVVQILNTLQKRGDITGFTPIEKKYKVQEDRILLFNELVSPGVFKSLGLDKMDKSSTDKDYFFTEKEIDEVYDAHIFEIRAIKIVSKSGMLIIPIEVSVKSMNYNIFIVYTSDEDVFYGSEDGDKTINDIKTLLGANWDIFEDTVSQIIDENIPVDYWDVINKVN